MNPYFSVGEEVILCSVDHQQYNGEYTIEEIVEAGQEYACKISGSLILFLPRDGIFGYRLKGLAIKSVYGKHEAVWCQKALRKKHKGSDKSFDQIVKSLHPTGITS